jgi:hypothetical protein
MLSEIKGMWFDWIYNDQIYKHDRGNKSNRKQMINPTLDPHKLSVREKIKLVQESDGLLIELLENTHVRGHLDLHGCTSLTHLPEGWDLVLEGILI